MEDFPDFSKQFYEKYLLLPDTKVVFDGNSLSRELSSNVSQYAIPYGRNYVDYTEYLYTFFHKLTRVFKIVPIVIFDGSATTESRKQLIDQKYKIFKDHLRETIELVKIVKSLPNGHIKKTYFANASTVLLQVLLHFNIATYQTIVEADDIVAMFALNYQCPVVTADRDFLLLNLPGGVIHLKDFIGALDGHNLDRINCDRYQVALVESVLKRIELLPLLRPFIKYDVSSNNVKVGKRFVTILASKASIKYNSNKGMHIITLLKWLNKQNGSLVDVCKQIIRVKEEVKNISGIDKNDVDAFVNKLKQVKQPLCHKLCGEHVQLDPTKSVEDFFRTISQISQLFPMDEGIPEQTYQGLLHAKIDPLLLHIRLGKLDIFSPMIEDDTLPSSYEWCFELCDLTYELIIGDDLSLSMTRIFHEKNSRRKINVTRKRIIENLPTLGKINDSNRKEWLFKIITKVLAKVDINLLEVQINRTVADKVLQKPMLIMLLSLIMCDLKCPQELTSTSKWSAFLRAMFTQIIYLGHLGIGQNSAKIIPSFIEIAPEKKEFLKTFNQTPSKLDIQITHFINAYQNCLQRINFLIQCLELYDTFGVDRCFCGLQGTFVHSLTLHQMDQTSDFDYFRNTILDGDDNLVGLAKMISKKMFNSESNVQSLSLTNPSTITSSDVNDWITPNHSKKSEKSNQKKTNNKTTKKNTTAAGTRFDILNHYE